MAVHSEKGARVRAVQAFSLSEMYFQSTNSSFHIIIGNTRGFFQQVDCREVELLEESVLLLHFTAKRCIRQVSVSLRKVFPRIEKVFVLLLY